jgi:tetratricopeptide (TPR) repeat protein
MISLPTNRRNLAFATWSALLILLPFAFHSAIYEGSLLPKLIVFQLALGVLLLTTLRNVKQQSLPHPLSEFLVLFAFLHLLSIASAANPLEAVLQLSQHLPFLGLPFLVVSTLSIKQLQRAILLAPWAGLPVALIGMNQYWGLDLFGIPSNAQPSATFFHRNAAAAYVICILPMAWVGFRCANSRVRVLAHAGLLLLLGSFLVFTRTRAAWVGLIGACAGIGLLSVYFPSSAEVARRNLKRGLFVAVCVMTALAAWLPENIQGAHRLQFDEKKSDAATAVASIFTEEGHRGRLALWQHTVEMILDHPLGVGLGNWQFQYPHHARGSHVNVTAAPEKPHNDFLWLASELGWIGLFAFLCVLGATFRIAVTAFRMASFEKRTMIQGLLTVLGAYLIDGLFSFPRGQVLPSLLFWFAIGGIALLSEHTSDLPVRVHRGIKGLSILLVGLCLLVTGKRIAYDSHHLQVHAAERNADWQKVIAEANRAHQIGTYRANTFIAQGRAFYHTGDFAAAEIAYKIALTRHPNSLNAYNNLGIVYRQVGKNELAEEAFMRALYLFPNFVEASFNLGNVYVSLNRWDEAFLAYRKAEGLGLNVPQLFFKLGQVAVAKGNAEEAKQYFGRALKRDPDFLPAIRALDQITHTP